MSWQWEGGSGLRVPSAARSPLDRSCRRPGSLHACMQDLREQEAHLECGGAVPPRLACCSQPRVLRPAAGEPWLWGCWASALLPASGWSSRRAHLPAPGPAAAATSAEGPLPHAALCLFFLPD